MTNLDDHNISFQEQLDIKTREIEKCQRAHTFTCQVCMEQKDARELASINSCVSHQFCCYCLVNWGLHQNKCPNCKQRYTMLAPAMGIQPSNPETRSLCLADQYNFYERDIMPQGKQQLQCKKSENLLKIIYGQAYGSSAGVFEMSKVKGGCFAF